MVIIDSVNIFFFILFLLMSCMIDSFELISSTVYLPITKIVLRLKINIKK